MPLWRLATAECSGMTRISSKMLLARVPAGATAKLVLRSPRPKHALSAAEGGVGSEAEGTRWLSGFIRGGARNTD